MQAVTTLAEKVAHDIRALLTHGALRPGQKLSEAGLAERLCVSRNTLREAFRLLTKDGLLRHEANRGVFVSVPTAASIIDIYRVRRVIECAALRTGYAQHPAVGRMADAVQHAKDLRAARDWVGVGSANMDFHAAIVELADSPRLGAFYGNIAAELRLAFGLLEEPEVMHAPFIPMNDELVGLMQRGQSEEAARRLDQYLVRSERSVLASFSRLSAAAS
ncbi:transcriptional regulator GntR family (plasmid) [Ketogulonicigenium robustum]|uniref:Transcriptional regulator GntR family n=2 Tax=Ketogulonicigenium robustum TaxID=92947 RepID=A0A1W6P3K6_9RHOB|nr:GntR family transcriptional regulator [Ketogulonicigenium robustum]ARO15993.1 transcriptional regulator GntR family [Ketogulonicigenium robustum]